MQKGTLERTGSKLAPKRLKYPSVITLSVNDSFGASASVPTSSLINWGWNPFLESLAWFVKKSKQLNQSYMASDTTALILTLSVNGPKCFVMIRQSEL